MPDFPIRRITVQIEEIHHDFGPAPACPRVLGAVMAVVKNPFAGRYEPDLESAMEDLKPLGRLLTDKLIAALGGLEGIDAYGKGAMVGEGGEAEHGALWHAPGGYTMRERLGESRAIVPSCMKVAPMGGSLDIPLGHINAAYVRGHFDSITVSVPDAPRAGEIVFALAMGKGGRINSRMGGLLLKDVKGEDGCR